MTLRTLAGPAGVTVMVKTFIVLFCTWHALALLVYTLPPSVAEALPEGLRSRAGTYLLAINQWQSWELFSPDPMRRMTRYRVDARLPSGASAQAGLPVAPDQSTAAREWRTVRTLEPANARLWRRSDEFSYPQRLDDGGTDAPDLSVRYLRALCAPLGLPEGTPVALTVEYIILPEQPPDDDWALWRAMMDPAGWDVWPVAVAPCPAPDDPALVPFRLL